MGTHHSACSVTSYRRGSPFPSCWGWCLHLPSDFGDDADAHMDGWSVLLRLLFIQTHALSYTNGFLWDRAVFISWCCRTLNFSSLWPKLVMSLKLFLICGKMWPGPRNSCHHLMIKWWRFIILFLFLCTFGSSVWLNAVNLLKYCWLLGYNFVLYTFTSLHFGLVLFTPIHLFDNFIYYSYYSADYMLLPN